MGVAFQHLAECRCGASSAAVSGRAGAGVSAMGADWSALSAGRVAHKALHGQVMMSCRAGKQRTCGRAVRVSLAGLGAAACACAGTRVLLARMREKGLRGPPGVSRGLCVLCWCVELRASCI